MSLYVLSTRIQFKKVLIFLPILKQWLFYSSTNDTANGETIPFSPQELRVICVTVGNQIIHVRLHCAAYYVVSVTVSHARIGLETRQQQRVKHFDFFLL